MIPNLQEGVDAFYPLPLLLVLPSGSINLQTQFFRTLKQSCNIRHCDNGKH